jgi:CAAX prenyl protease-like protein
MSCNQLPASESQAEQPRAPSAGALSGILPYAAPILAYVGLSGLEGYLPQDENRPSAMWYPLAYAAKVVLVGALAWACRSTWKDLRPFPRAAVLGTAVVIGIIVWGLWIGLDGLYPVPAFIGGRVGFDPGVLKPAPRAFFIAVRMLGLVFLVPLIEELFARDFVIRWVIDPDFERVPIGRVTPLAAAVSSVLFALTHPEWLPALLTGLLWAGLLWRTKSLSACVVSHAIANLALGIYVIASGNWKYW